MKKNFLMSALLVAVGMMFIASCDENGESEVINGNQQQEVPAQGKAVVKLMFSPSLSVSTRASLMANGSQLTDLYILDYDKTSGKLLQVLHQTSAANDFAEPSMQFDYGEHVLKVIATRSISPTLLNADGSLWSLADNTAFSLTENADEPLIWTSEKTSDTFGVVQEVTITADKNQSIHIQLERLVAKLVVKNTEKFPDDCSTIQLSLNEYKKWNWKTFSVIEAENNQRISDVSSYAGTSGNTLAYYMLTPDDGGYTTDITFTMNRKDSTTPYATITMPDVQLQRNHITTITGSFYNHEAWFSISLNDEWDKEQNTIEF